MLGQSLYPAPYAYSKVAGIFYGNRIYSFKIEGRTVPGGKKVPMVRALENLAKFMGKSISTHICISLPVEIGGGLDDYCLELHDENN